jgi:hypothetical protein
VLIAQFISGQEGQPELIIIKKNQNNFILIKIFKKINDFFTSVLSRAD